MAIGIIDELRDAFNEAAGSIRVITFLSPTCGPCRYGQGVVRALFEETPGDDLGGFVIWVPMLPGDNAGTAGVEQEAITDRRFRFWFDADKAAADAWSSFTGYAGTTWDVYAIYDRAAVWNEGSPPSPLIWMHQLNITPATQLSDRLDVSRLAREWLQLTGRGSMGDAALALKLHEKGKAVSAPR